LGSLVAPELAQHVTNLHNRAILRHEGMGESIDPHPMSLLTLREREVAKCVADGMAGVEMGRS
jgi:DNA-binding CsgD family transcriptional regulator